MIRVALWNLFLFLLPFIAAWIWRYWTQKRHPVRRVRIRWAWLMFCGVFLVLASLLTWRLASGEDPQKNYVPPQHRNGEIVPGHFE